MQDEADARVAGRTPWCADLTGFDWRRVDGGLSAAIADLPLPYCAVFLLWSVEGLGYERFAKTLCLSVSVARGRLYRAFSAASIGLGAVEHAATIWFVCYSVRARRSRDARADWSPLNRRGATGVSTERGR